MSSSQVVELLIAYGAALAALLVSLIQNRATWRHFLRAPVIAVAVVVAGVAMWSLLRAAMPSTQGVAPSASFMRITGTLFLAVLGYAVGLWLSRPPPEDSLKRGTLIEEGGRPGRARAGQLTVADIPIPQLDETKHFKMIGTTGTGKSTAIRELLAGALERGDRVIIADPDAGYLKRFYDVKAGDVILNPFDARSRRWDLFGEIEQTYDVEQLARSLIPDHDGPDKTWRSYARTFLTAVTRQLWELGRDDPRNPDHQMRNLAELYRLVSIASAEELKILVSGTPAQPFLDAGNERMFGSIRSVASASLQALEHIAEQSAPPLSVRQWVRGGHGRALYLPYSASQVSALRALISAWMRIAIFEAMSGAERDQRLWFVVDELDALGTIDGLKDALARLRKFGGRCVLGFQSIAQVSSTYGQGETQTIVENCGNTLILRCSASEQGGTARFASRLIGDREVVRLQESRSRRPGEWQVTRNTSEQHVTEAAVLPSEIEQLPDLQGYLKIASQPSWRLASLRPIK